MTAAANSDQSRYWNSGPGAKWIAFQTDLDTIFRSVSEMLFDHSRPAPGERVLDIGCGTGETTLALAEKVGRGGVVHGVDISQQLLDFAEQRRAAAGRDNVSFIMGDAQTFNFELESADLIFSRFGVMFFDDPVRAFTNLAGALRPGGRACFATWASMARNPWFSVPRDAAVAQLGAPAPAPPNAPGPLAFQDQDYVLGILNAAGFEHASAEIVTLDLFHPEGLEKAAGLASNIGPAARILKEFNGTEKDVAAIAKATAKGFEAFVKADGARVPAVLNLYQATKA